MSVDMIETDVLGVESEVEDDGKFDVNFAFEVIGMTGEILRDHARTVKRFGVFCDVVVNINASRLKKNTEPETDALVSEILEQVNLHSPQYVTVELKGDEYKFVFHHP